MNKESNPKSTQSGLKRATKHTIGVLKAIFAGIVAAWVINIPFVVIQRVFGWISMETYNIIWYFTVIPFVFSSIGHYIIKSRKNSNSNDGRNREGRKISK